MSVPSSRSSQSRNRDNVIRGSFRVSITPIRSCVKKSTNNQIYSLVHPDEFDERLRNMCETGSFDTSDFSEFATEDPTEADKQYYYYM